MKAYETAAYIGSVLGGVTLFITISSSNGAPQEAAGAAIAVALAVVPYCFCATKQRAALLLKSKD